MQAARVHVCGRIAIAFDGRRLDLGPVGRQGRLAFAYLVLHRDRAVTREELAAAIWPEAAPATASASLRVIVSRLRAALGPGAIEGRGDLRLVLGGRAWVDLEVAAEKVHEAESAVHAQDWARAVPAATIAYVISGRGFMPGEDADWVIEQRRRLEEIHLRALECDATASLGIGGSEIAVAEREARRLIRLAPFRESGHRLLMRALARTGNRAEALVVYERLRRALRDELGASPGPETQAVHRELLRAG